MLLKIINMDILFFCLVLFNLILIYDYSEEENKIRILTSLLIKHERIESNNEIYLNKGLKFIGYHDKNYKIKLIYVVTTSRFIDKQEQEFLSNIFRKYPKFIEIFSSERTIALKNATFNYKLIKGINIFNKEINFKDSTAFIIDKNGRVHAVYVIDYNNRDEARNMIERINSLLYSIYG